MSAAGSLTGVELNVVPPVAVDVDSPAERYEKLSNITADYTVHRLLELHGQLPDGHAAHVPGREDVRALAKLVLGPQDDGAAGFLLGLKDRGVSLDDLYLRLLGPTATYLGHLWEQDRIDFVDVTLGVARLQRLVITFEQLDCITDREDKCRILIVGAPGEQHSFGHTIVQRFFRASGWQVWSCVTSDAEEVVRIAGQDWFAIVGFSLSDDTHFRDLRKAILKIRAASLNRDIGVIVGGSSIDRNPDWVAELGADGTAENGAAAVILAKKLLAASLSQYISRD
jgi:methanogenic corrinoid protein MtbC1